ncbi:MAG TPA: tetratricopeptide repeat protein [Chitinispirillaceae bacterium]|nr:tetratricopeptide repeat protein [Chitinispirillaceae bacterium]
MKHFSSAFYLKMITVSSFILSCFFICYSKDDSSPQTRWRIRENLALRFGSEFDKINSLNNALSSASDIINEIRDFQLFPNGLTRLSHKEIVAIDSCLDMLEKDHSTLLKKIESLKSPLVDAIEILREMVTGVPVENMFEVLEKGDMKRIGQMIEIKDQINTLWTNIDSLLITVMTGIGLKPEFQTQTTDSNLAYDEFLDIIQSALGHHLKKRYDRLELIKNHLVSNGSKNQILEIYNIEKHRIKVLISDKNFVLAEKKLKHAINRFDSIISIDDLYLLLFRSCFLEKKYTDALKTIAKVSDEANLGLKQLYRIQTLYALQRCHDVLDEMADTDITRFKGKNRNLLIWLFLESSLSAGIIIDHSELASAIDRRSSYALHVIHSLARTYLKNQDTATAISVMNGAFNYKINSEIDMMAFSKIKLSLAQLHYERGDYNNALSAFFQLLNDHNEYEHALFGILWCYIKLDQFEKVEVTLRKLVNQSPESPYAAKATLVMAEHYLQLATSEWEKLLYLESEEQRLSLLHQQLAKKISADTSLRNDVKFKIASQELSLLMSRVKSEPRKKYDNFIEIFNKTTRICEFIINHYSTGSFQDDFFSVNREKMLFYLDSLILEINRKDHVTPIIHSNTLDNRTKIKMVVDEARAFKIHADLAFYKWKLEFLDKKKTLVHKNLISNDSIKDTALAEIAKQRLDSIIVVEDSTKSHFFDKLTPLLHSILDNASDFPDAAYFRYQLGELYYENEISEYTKKYDLYEKELDLYHFANEDYQNGKISQKPVPPTIVKLDHTKSIDQFKNVITNYPLSPFCGASHYSLAWCYNDLAMFDSAFFHMEKVAIDFPQNYHAPQAWMYCGEFYFDRAELDQAAQCYQAVMKYTDSEWFDEALYKLAWTQYRQSNPNKAISSFLALVDLGESSPDGRSLLEKESLDYIAISFSETDILGEYGLKRANAFAKKLGSSTQSYQILHRLANVYREQGRYDMAEKTYTTILNDYPDYPKNAKVESELISVMENKLPSDDLNKLKTTFFNKYNLNSTWAQTQSDSIITAAADSIASKYLYDAAISYHQLALQDNKSPNYASALKTYKTFLEHYPSSPQANECHYNLAEIQFSTGDYYKAAEEYMAVSKLYPESKYRETAAWNAVVAAQNLLLKEQSDE